MQISQQLKKILADLKKRLDTPNWNEYMSRTKELLIEATKRIIKRNQEGNHNEMKWKMLIVPCRLGLKFGANIQEMITKDIKLFG